MAQWQHSPPGPMTVSTAALARLRDPNVSPSRRGTVSVMSALTPHLRPRFKAGGDVANTIRLLEVNGTQT